MKKQEIKVDLRLKQREAARTAGRNIPKVPQDLPEPALSENAAYIAKTRYAFRDERGEPVETPRELFWRVAYYIGAADRIYLENSKKKSPTKGAHVHKESAGEFYRLMAAQKFIPNTPTLVNSGKIGQSLSACFVLPVEDDLESILKTMRDMAMIHKMGGGTGFSFSRLRPKDDVIGTSKGKTTGPVAFLQAYNDVTSQIRQGGVRRGANMGILHYTHPDILRFAVHKVDEFSLTNFNISVTVTEDFMEKVKEDAKFLSTELEVDDIIEELKEAYAIRDLDLKNVLVEEAVQKLYAICQAKEEQEGYDLINPRTKEVTGKLNAKRVFDLITKLAWQYGDPGIILIDRVNNSRANPTPLVGEIEATNPCGEQPLLPYDACTLGSINLSKFIETAKASQDAQDRINWKELKEAIHTAIHFLDNVLDMNEYPVAEIDQMTSNIRRIGLGVMGWADMLVELGIGFNTEESFSLAGKVMEFVQHEADMASVDLAKIRGVFPAFKGSIYDVSGGLRVRNAARTTIAPTGTISLLADCSSGIEPHFALTYAKNTIEGKRLFNTNLYFQKALKEKGIYSDELLEKIQDNNGSIQNMDEFSPELKKVFVTAGDISPLDHVRIQAAFQKYTDNGISKTINFPNDATVEDVRNAYWLTYELDCKMITIYRDGSRTKQVLETKKGKSYYDQLNGKKLATESSEDLPFVPAKRPTPQEAWGMRVRKKADVGQVYTSVFRDGDGTPVEVFVNIGKTGGYVSGAAEVTGRLASRALKYGASLEEIATDLVGISCGTPYGLGPESVLSAFDAVGKSLLEIARAKQLQLPVEDTEQSRSILRENESTVEKVSKTTLSTNGNGHSLSNGHTNGHTNGYSNGYSNGNGHSNGHTNGYTNGDGKAYIEGTEQQISMSQVPLAGLGLLPVTSSDIIHTEKAIETKFDACPECSSSLVYAEGCKKCITCGWSKCS